MSKFVPDHSKTNKQTNKQTNKCVSMKLKNYLIYKDMFPVNMRLSKTQ